MDSCVHQFAECGIDHPLPLDAAFASKCRTFDVQREVALASRMMTAVPPMLFAVVRQIDSGG